MKDRVEHSPITPASDESLKRIVKNYIDPKLQVGAQMESVIQRFTNETKVLFEQSMKKSQCKIIERRTSMRNLLGIFLVRDALIAPNVKGLENETAGPPAPEPSGYGRRTMNTRVVTNDRYCLVAIHRFLKFMARLVSIES
jgi:hypothetical protein